MGRELFEWNNGMSPGPGRPAGQEEDEGSGAEYLRSLKKTDSQGKQSPPASPAATALPVERRRSMRYRCDGSAEFRTEGSDVRTWGTLADISLHGCYVEMTATYPVGTVVELTLDAAGVRVHATGEVKVSYPFLGVGIALKELAREEEARLRELLQRLSARANSIARDELAPPTSEAPVALPALADAGELVKALSRFFESHSSLSRDEFLHMLRGGAESR
jgi:hypothetical protein